MPDGSSTQPVNSRIILSGAGAGLTVDLVLFPIDTIKSRIQSKQGFLRSGGFSNPYRGLSPVLAGSIPTSVLFFVTYETSRAKIRELSNSNKPGFVVNVASSSLAEVVSCSLRVPFEVVKMRSQTSETKVIHIIKGISHKDGHRGFYRGFLSTIARDVPFSAIQYPIWELLKQKHLIRFNQGVNTTQSALYAMVSGAIAAFMTTPLDVAKTRIMLAKSNESIASGNIIETMRTIYFGEGIRGLFAGVLPRVVWISAGAAIYLGSYDFLLNI